MSQHLLKAVDHLKRKALFLGSIVEEHLQRAVDSVATRDSGLAARVIASDVEVDQMEVEIEEECLKMLALYQPVATDLRFIAAVMKLNNDLERIGDLAVNIAEHAAWLAVHEPLSIPPGIRSMSETALRMLKSALDALVNMDASLAAEICAQDDTLDALDREMFRDVEDWIRRDPDKVEALMRILSISRHLERVGDHATNIAEDVVYMSEGTIVRHKAEDLTDIRNTSAPQ